MHTAEISVKAFCSTFSFKVQRRSALSINGARRYVRHTLGWDTAQVTGVLNIPEKADTKKQSEKYEKQH